MAAYPRHTCLGIRVSDVGDGGVCEVDGFGRDGTQIVLVPGGRWDAGCSMFLSGGCHHAAP